MSAVLWLAVLAALAAPAFFAWRTWSLRRDVHFKIIDDGRKGYVSAHPPESFERRYRSYDCSKVAPHVRQAALGRHMDSIAGLFQEEARAVA